jgi:hypothetical protein
MAQMKHGISRIPAHIVEQYGTVRKWKALKRRHLREAYNALAKLRQGCAFFPCGAHPVGRAMNELDAVYEAIKEESWGR